MTRNGMTYVVFCLCGISGCATTIHPSPQSDSLRAIGKTIQQQAERLDVVHPIIARAVDNPSEAAAQSAIVRDVSGVLRSVVPQVDKASETIDRTIAEHVKLERRIKQLENFQPSINRLVLWGGFTAAIGIVCAILLKYTRIGVALIAGGGTMLVAAVALGLISRIPTWFIVGVAIVIALAILWIVAIAYYRRSLRAAILDPWPWDDCRN